MATEEEEGYFFELLPQLVVFATTSCVVFLPIYIYGWIRFRQRRHSIIISKRFPTLCIAISAVSYSCSLSLMLRFWIQQTTARKKLPIAVSHGFGYLLDCMVTLRLILVYLRYKQTQQSLLHLESNDRVTSAHDLSLSSASPTEPEPVSPSTSSMADSFEIVTSVPNQRKNLYLRPACIAMYIFSFVSFVWLSFATQLRSVYGIVTVFLYIIDIALMLIVVYIVLCKKVKDGIGCLKETGLVLLFTLLVILLTTFMDMVVSQRTEVFIKFVLYIIVPLIQGIIPLYGGLYFVYKLEKADKVRENVAMQAANASMSVLQSADLPMHIFLKRYENYKLFREYLSHCWAVENLLFLQTVAILTRILSKYQKEETIVFTKQQSESIDVVYADGPCEDADASKVDERIWLQCGFEYLENEFKTYNSALSKLGIAKADKEFEDVKQRVFTVYRAIYIEFIKYGSLHEVNISYEQRSKLAFLFETDGQSQRFQSLADFVHVFDDAMLEVYQLTQSMYNFDFKQYIRNNMQ